MARISDLNKYYYDYNISDKDYLLGTNADNNNKTQSYPMIALADYVRNFLTNMNYDKVISIGEILSIDNTIIINVNNLGNVVYIGGKFYSKNTQDVFTFTPVTEGVKVIILYALPDEQIFYMLEGEQSLEAIEPTLPNNALFIRRIIVTEQGININPNDVQIIDEKVQITEDTNFAQIGQTQKDFNKNVSDYKASSDLKNQEQDGRLENIESENTAQNDLINGLQADLDNQIAVNANQDERLVNLEGINYTWSPTNRTLTLFDREGNQLSQVSLVSLDNEGTDIRYNPSTLSLELYNADNELLDSIPVSSFIGSVGTQLQLNSNQLQLKDSQGNILSTVTFAVSNIQGLQTTLDGKLDKGIYSGTAQDLKNSIDGKLNKPTTTSNTTSYPFVVGEDGNGNSARLPAGDLGKNFFNSDLSNTTARNHTMNAGVTINTLGNPHTLSGLPNKNADITNFRKVRVQNASGLDAIVDNKNLLIDSVSYLTNAEKLDLATSLNGGYSSATMSVGGILPINVSNFFDELTYVTLIGNNLNLNPANFSVKILDINNNVVADVSSQSSINNVTSLTFWFNFHNFPAGTYKVRLTNGAATLTTTTTFEVNNQNISKNEIDTSTLTWLEASNVGAPFINNYQKGTTSAGIVISANATGIVIGNSTLKSSPIINTADYDNFYLIIEGNANYNTTINTFSSNIAQIGIVKNPTNVVDANESINLGVQMNGLGNSGMGTNSFGSFPPISVSTKPSYFKLHIFKRQNSITYILQIGTYTTTLVETIVTDFKIGLMVKGTPFSNGSNSINSFYITNISGYTF